MAGQLCPSPTAYKVAFGIGIVLCLVTYLAACKMALSWQKSILRVRDFIESNKDDQHDSDDEDQDQQEPQKPSISKLLCTVLFALVAAVVFLVCIEIYAERVMFLVILSVIQLSIMLYRYCKPSSNETLKHLYFTSDFYGLLVLTAITFVAAFLVLTVHAHAMMTDISNYDYYGPMRVTGVDASVERIYRSSSWFDEMRGQVQLEFGGEWACPKDSDSACVSVTWDDSMCNKIVCSSQWEQCSDDDDASDYTLECQQNRYANALALVDAGAEYDPSVPPEQDENSWPYVKAFGKCSSCEAIRYPDKLDVAVRSCEMAMWLIILGASLTFLSGIMYWSRRRIDAADNDAELLPNEHGTSA